MPIPTTTASPWPARCAYISAAIFTAASGLTNLIYGWQKGDTSRPRSCGRGSPGPSPSCSPSLAGPDSSRLIAGSGRAALISLVALLLSGRVQLISAALGSASGGPDNAAARGADGRPEDRAQAAYDAAKASWNPGHRQARTELQALLTAPSPSWPSCRRRARRPSSMRCLLRPGGTHGGYGCAAVNGSLAIACPKPSRRTCPGAPAERAGVEDCIDGGGGRPRPKRRLQERRAGLGRPWARAGADLARPAGPERLVNSDAKRYTRYLGALGLEVSPDRLTTCWYYSRLS